MNDVACAHIVVHAHILHQSIAFVRQWVNLQL